MEIKILVNENNDWDFVILCWDGYILIMGEIVYYIFNLYMFVYLNCVVIIK